MNDFWRRRYDVAHLDLGSGVKADFFKTEGESDNKGGIFIMREHDDGEICVGTVFFDVPENILVVNRPKWKLVSMDPLHLEPSIRQSSGPDMTECLHGHIKDGRWVPV